MDSWHTGDYTVEDNVHSDTIKCIQCVSNPTTYFRFQKGSFQLLAQVSARSTFNA